ncbi:MAG: polysaccharide pyruvyl transferase family protein [Cyclobacteriaceae bacterium]|nr:polysaccharide pyruvyl transferase family protein [Cyclobacteriaceae bacterium]
MNRPLREHYQAARLGVMDLIKGVTPYVGYYQNHNLGDVELYKIVKGFYRGKKIVPDVRNRGKYFNISKIRSKDQYLVGGGTLIFAKNILKACEWLSKYDMKPVFLGTGALDTPPQGEELERWLKIFQQASYIGVRGTISQKILKDLGVQSEVLGDLAFLVNLEQESPLASNNEVVIVPRSIRPSYYEYFEKDMSTRRLLGEFVERCLQEKIPVKILCVCGDDAPIIRGWLESIPAVTYLEYENEFDLFKDTVMASGCLVSMRMHPGIFAAAWGVPTILLDQRHKFFDSFSPLDNPVADILDPESLPVTELLQRVKQKLNESMQNRLERFELVRPLALKQQKFFMNLDYTSN